jgi:hypothetical protein
MDFLMCEDLLNRECLLAGGLLLSSDVSTLVCVAMLRVSQADEGRLSGR